MLEGEQQVKWKSRAGQSITCGVTSTVNPPFSVLSAKKRSDVVAIAQIVGIIVGTHPRHHLRAVERVWP
jgi:hypothetical protein